MTENEIAKIIVDTAFQKLWFGTDPGRHIKSRQQLIILAPLREEIFVSLRGSAANSNRMEHDIFYLENESF